MTVPAFKLALPLRVHNPLNGRGHWGIQYRRNKTQRSTVHLAFPARAKGLLGRGEWPACVVTLTRVSPSRLDPGDNLPASMKGCRDQVALELGLDDRDPRIAFIYAHRKGAVREYGVEIIIERAAPKEE